MDIESIRKHCLTLPHATEKVQWGDNLCFKIAGKLFAILSLEPAAVRLSFKCTPEKYAELIEVEGIVPAPYLARAHWVGLAGLDVLRPAELKSLLALSYDLVFQRISPKERRRLG